MSLLYDTVCPGMRDNEFNRQIDDIRLRFGIGAEDVRFHPYFDDEDRVVADNASVWVSLHSKKQRVRDGREHLGGSGTGDPDSAPFPAVHSDAVPSTPGSLHRKYCYSS